MKTRILVVDDEFEFTSMMKANLESRGYYEVAAENDEGHAVAAAREFGPDLILMDIMMPRLEGNEVAAMIREVDQLRDTPILFLSALISELDAPQGSYTCNGNTFVPKSVAIDRLMSCINEGVNERRRAKKLARTNAQTVSHNKRTPLN